MNVTPPCAPGVGLRSLGRATDHDSIVGVRAGGALVALLATLACSGDSTRPPDTTHCSTGQATSQAVGEVTSPLTGTSLCASGGAGGAEYVLVPFNSSTAGAKVSFDVTATGVSAVSSAQLSMLPGTSGGGAGRQLAAATAFGGSRAFEARVRAREAALDPLIPAARRRAALRTRGSAASRAVIPSNVIMDQRLELNTNSDDACANPILSVGRVVALTAKSVVVADTANPIGGFTAADYQSFAATFDDIIYPLITSNFGTPADIDGNGRVLLFFTRTVNELTPADNNGSYVGGFFFGRDLFPPTSPEQGFACASSNFGELFYLLVPDPTGVVNGNEFTTADVREIALSIVAHEFQHLINASRRIYVSATATEFEEVWLNEGLSHVAEELLFFQRSGLHPRMDLTESAIRASQTIVDAFNADAGANFGRFKEYLETPPTSSPYADNDSLATRGATWSFLRYAVDRQNTTDSNLWFRLVNTDKTGIANLRDVFGADVMGMFRDWSTSVVADNLTGVAAKYQQPSWNLRSIYRALYDSYPLSTVSLVAGTPRNLQIIGGGSAYLRFAVPAGGAGQVTWGTVPSTMQMTLLRTR
jgi:hypothetical protein